MRFQTQRPAQKTLCCTFWNLYGNARQTLALPFGKRWHLRGAQRVALAQEMCVFGNSYRIAVVVTEARCVFAAFLNCVENRAFPVWVCRGFRCEFSRIVNDASVAVSGRVSPHYETCYKNTPKKRTKIHERLPKTFWSEFVAFVARRTQSSE